VFVEHRGRRPRVAESAYIAPTAVLCGDVTVGEHSRVLFGAVVTAEGGPVDIGAHCVVMEHAVIRGTPGHEARLGDHVIVGPHTHLSGCVVEGDSRVATGAVIFNGARIGATAEVQLGAVVHVNTVVPAGARVPIGWVALGDPAEILPAGDAERIQELLGPLDFPGTVFGVAPAEGGEPLMPDVARRYTRGLARHREDRVLDSLRPAPRSAVPPDAEKGPEPVRVTPRRTRRGP
jgi:carbonic anhydrase/acetyltransferase-like protein (isoleucine patch superfamily)